MNNSFALILSQNNKYEQILNESSIHYDIQFNKLSHDNASAIHYEKQFILDVTPNKMHFLFPEEINQEKYEDVLELTRRFITENFANQVIGIKYYDQKNQDLINDLNGVRTMKI